MTIIFSLLWSIKCIGSLLWCDRFDQTEVLKFRLELGVGRAFRTDPTGTRSMKWVLEVEGRDILPLSRRKFSSVPTLSVEQLRSVTST